MQNWILFATYGNDFDSWGLINRKRIEIQITRVFIRIQSNLATVNRVLSGLYYRSRFIV